MAELRPAPFSRLYPILDAALEDAASFASGVEALARAGCRLIQLRGKELSTRELFEWSKLGAEAARELGAKLVVNDRADVALVAGADGVHLGQEDLSPVGARRVLGESAVIGLSTHDVAQARASAAEPVDYVAIGPVFATSSKSDHEAPLGLEGLVAIRRAVARPLVAIGGITLETAPAVLRTGVDGVAVISALKTGGDLEAVARRWLSLLKERADGR